MKPRRGETRTRNPMCEENWRTPVRFAPPYYFHDTRTWTTAQAWLDTQAAMREMEAGRQIYWDAYLKSIRNVRAP